MAGFLVFLPFRVVLEDQVQKVLFGFNMGKAYKIIDVPFADMAPVFHLMQSSLQQQLTWLQLPLAVPKQGKLPSLCWIVLIRVFLE